MTPDSAAAPDVRSAARRAAVVGSAVAMLAASAIGSGAFGGTPVEEAAGGALAADATLVAPDVPAFAIWSVIYGGLLALAVWQALPRQAASARLRRLDPLVIASMLLNGAWILSVQAGWLAVSVALILALLAVLAILFRATTADPPSGRVEAVLLDGAMGLYLGWVSVATVANVTAWLAASGVGPGLGENWVAGDVIAVVVLGVAALVGVLLARRGRGRISFAFSMVWGLAWIAVARFAGDLVAVPVGLAAAVAATVIAAAVVAGRVHRPAV